MLSASTPIFLLSRKNHGHAAVDEAFRRFWLRMLEWLHEIFKTRTYSLLHEISYSDLHEISEKNIEMGFGGVCQEMCVRGNGKKS